MIKKFKTYVDHEKEAKKAKSKLYEEVKNLKKENKKQRPIRPRIQGTSVCVCVRTCSFVCVGACAHSCVGGCVCVLCVCEREREREREAAYILAYADTH